MTESKHDEIAEFLPLHSLEFQILLSLMDGVAHAYRIVQHVEERQPDWSRILPTNLYRRIWRLASLGLIEEVPGETAPSERSRKYFEILPLGRRVAAAEAERLRQLLADAASTGIVPSDNAGGS